MLLKRTLAQLDVGYVSPEQAEKMGHLGFMQWLGALPGNANYSEEVSRAFELARPFIKASPAVHVFCQLLDMSARTPLAPLDLKLPVPMRRGGAKARRGVL